MNVGNHQDKNVVSGSNLCRHDRSMSAKCADIWLFGRHVADMSATFPAKAKTERLKKVKVVEAELEKAKIAESTITGPAYDLFRKLL